MKLFFYLMMMSGWLPPCHEGAADCRPDRFLLSVSSCTSSFRMETLKVSATKGPNVEDGHRKPLSHQNRKLKKWANLREDRVLLAAVPLGR